MEKTIKVIALTTTQQVLISEIREVAAVDIGDPDCFLGPSSLTTLGSRILTTQGLFR